MPFKEATLSASPLHREMDVPELAGHASDTFDDLARLDDAAAEPRPDDGRDRRFLGGS
jgi:hypothetical protein